MQLFEIVCLFKIVPTLDLMRLRLVITTLAGSHSDQLLLSLCTIIYKATAFTECKVIENQFEKQRGSLGDHQPVAIPPVVF